MRCRGRKERGSVGPSILTWGQAERRGGALRVCGLVAPTDELSWPEGEKTGSEQGNCCELAKVVGGGRSVW